MKKLRLGFTDTFGAVEEFFTEHLSREYDIIRDDVDPDYLIFGDTNFGTNNENFNNKKCVKIFYTGENQHFWDYACHYSITFDHFDDERHYRLPLYVLYDWDNKRKGIHHSSSIGLSIDAFNRKFCSFVVKNPGCTKRNEFFHKLNAYRWVDSAGPLFNNTGEILERGENSVQSKFNFISDYKFNLCFENSSYPGYATEKVYEALVCGTVPIYWGSTTIGCDFNPKAIINWHDYLDDDKLLEAVIEADRHRYEYNNYYLPPAFHKPNKYMDMDRFLFWFNKNVYRGELK